MGIKGLAKFLGDYASSSLRPQQYDSFTGRVIAIDASMSLYQFMIAIRDGESYGTLTNEAGETTSHISGMLSRAVRLMEHGIKPVYVFDGKPPQLKTGELAKRQHKRDKAEEELEAARAAGNMEEVKKQMGRTVKVSKQHNEDVKKLLTLMGLPVVNAPCEAEAQCAELTKGGKAYATATEDADALTFGSNILIRNLNFSDQQKAKGYPILAIHLQTVLEELKFSMDQFVDFCILCGCDYCDTIRGIGAKTAYSLIQSHKTIEGVLENIDKTKHAVPDNFPYEQAREFFHSPEVTKSDEIKLEFKDGDYEGLRKFLVDEHNFNAQRIQNYLARLKKARGKSSQMRLESFFGATTIKSSTAKKEEHPPKGKGKGAAGSKVGGTKRKSASLSSQPPSSSSSSSPSVAMLEGAKKVKTDTNEE